MADRSGRAMNSLRVLGGRRPGLVTDRQILERSREPGQADDPGQVTVRPVDSRPLLTTGNGRVSVDWLAAEPGRAALVTHPSFGWFSVAHRRHVRIGTWGLRLVCDGQPASLSDSRSWYMLSAVPTTYARVPTDTDETLLSVSATGVCPPQEQAWVMRVKIENETHQCHTVGLLFEGDLSVGEEFGYTRSDSLARRDAEFPPLPPVKVECRGTSHGIQACNDRAGVYAVLRGSEPAASVSLQQQLRKRVVRDEHDQAALVDWCCETTHFSLLYNLLLEPTETKELSLIIGLGGSLQEAEETAERLSAWGPHVAQQQALRHWESVLAPFREASLPDRLLEAALRRCYVYSTLLSVPLGEERFFFTDHVHLAACWSRDGFYQAAALLYFRPKEVAGYLRFLFETGIPRSGVGRLYLADGSRPPREGDWMLDLACYPFLSLRRYWRFTGDSGLVARDSMAKGMDQLLEQIEPHRCETTGLYRSTRRSSDEECLLPISVAGNMLLACTLEAVAEMAEEAQRDRCRAQRARERAVSIREALARHAVKQHERFGPVYAWEVDEHGRYFLYDQADMPNLLTMPYWGFCPSDDPIYRSTVEFAFSQENEGYAETADGWFAALCDGTKTDPDGPWTLGVLGELMAGRSPQRTREILDWLRHTVTPGLQFSEIVDKHTGGVSSRIWFIWPTALFVVAYLEILCGIRVGRTVRVDPQPPAGWPAYQSPAVQIRGHEIRVRVEAGTTTVWVDGKETSPGELALA